MTVFQSSSANFNPTLTLVDVNNLAATGSHEDSASIADKKTLNLELAIEIQVLRYAILVPPCPPYLIFRQLEGYTYGCLPFEPSYYCKRGAA